MASSIETGTDTDTEYAALRFIITSILARVATTIPVKVISCSNQGGLSAWGTVSVQPLVAQVSGDNTAVQHGQLFNLPYLRIQGGTNAIIMDPQPGDIGAACFCSRDISSLKQQTAIDQIKGGSIVGVPPASARQYSMSDGIYMGGMLNAVPVQYIRFASNEIEVVSPTKIKLTAPTVEISASTEVKITSTTKVTVDSPANDIKGGATKIDNKTFLLHEHSGVTVGSGVSGPVV